MTRLALLIRGIKLLISWYKKHRSRIHKVVNEHGALPGKLAAKFGIMSKAGPVFSVAVLGSAWLTGLWFIIHANIINIYRVADTAILSIVIASLLAWALNLKVRSDTDILSGPQAVLWLSALVKAANDHTVIKELEDASADVASMRTKLELESSVYSACKQEQAHTIAGLRSGLAAAEGAMIKKIDGDKTTLLCLICDGVWLESAQPVHESKCYFTLVSKGSM